MNKDFLKLKIASPQKILEWSERLLPNFKNIGEIKNTNRLNKNF
jgi:hypothetical protein